MRLERSGTDGTYRVLDSDEPAGAADDRAASDVVLDAVEAWSSAIGIEPSWRLEVIEPVPRRSTRARRSRGRHPCFAGAR